ncbi:MAG: hypothetical protein ACPGXY_05595 [Alphaproteobacteria bacterium]
MKNLLLILPLLLTAATANSQTVPQADGLADQAAGLAGNVPAAPVAPGPTILDNLLRGFNQYLDDRIRSEDRKKLKENAARKAEEEVKKRTPKADPQPAPQEPRGLFDRFFRPDEVEDEAEEADNEVVVEEEPEAVVDEEPEAVVDEDPEPAVEEEPEPVVDEEPEAVVDEEPEAVVEEEPEAIVDEEPEEDLLPRVEAPPFPAPRENSQEGQSEEGADEQEPARSSEEGVSEEEDSWGELGGWDTTEEEEDSAAEGGEEAVVEEQEPSVEEDAEVAEDPSEEEPAVEEEPEAVVEEAPEEELLPRVEAPREDSQEEQSEEAVDEQEPAPVLEEDAIPEGANREDAVILNEEGAYVPNPYYEESDSSSSTEEEESELSERAQEELRQYDLQLEREERQEAQGNIQDELRRKLGIGQ